MVRNNQISNRIFYDENSGVGGEWELSIDTSGLDGAATEYSGAATDYNTALETLIASLNSALTVWSDKSSETWKQKITEAQANLQAVSAAMSKNSTILTEIASAASATETSVATGISNI